MTSTRARARASERIVALGASGLDDRELRRRVLAVLGEVIDFDAYVWLLTDPVTTVGTAPLADVPCISELPALIKAKYGTPVNRWTTLAQQASRAALLTEAVDGDLGRSRFWREVLVRYGVGDVASVVFADQYGCWGFLDLWRASVSESFDAGDAKLMASLAAPLATALRLCQARTFARPATAHMHDAGAVVLTLDEDLLITSRTSASKAWLDVLLPPEPDQRAIPASVYNVAAQLLAAEEGVDDHPAFARTHLADGFWLTLRAARLAADQADAHTAGPALVVTIEETSAGDRRDVFSRAFGLTPREQEVLTLLAAGSDTRAMARRMSLSELTVQDHLKSIFTKTGAHDRVTLLSRALGSRGEQNLAW